MHLRLAVPVCLFVLVASGAVAQDRWSDPHPGVRLLQRTTNAPNRIFVAVVDLSRAGVRVRATRSEDRQATTSAFAREYGVAVAVNGDFYSGNRQPTGLAVGDGERWAGTRDTNWSGFAAFGRDNRALVSRPGAVVDPPADWMSEVVSGRPLVVRGGRAIDPPECGAHACARHPRTAVGLSEDRQTLFLMVVDGRSDRSRGMTTREVGNVLAGLGAHTALNLDGGGSSTLYVRGAGGVLNSPSDGAERAVANHLGIQLTNGRGRLVGFVRAEDVYDEAAGIERARVALSSGASTRTDARGFYEFAAIAAGEVDVTARAPGFQVATRAVTVTAGDTTWGSIALRPAPEPEPDMGPPPVPEDMGVEVEPDASDAETDTEVDPAEVPEPDAAFEADFGEPAPDAASSDASVPFPVRDFGVGRYAEAEVSADEAGGCRQGPVGVPFLFVLLAVRRRRC